MKNRTFIGFVLTVFLAISSFTAYAQDMSDKICGRWVSTDRNLIVDVYKQDNAYKAKIIWFDAGNDKLMHEWVDKNNPDKLLQSRKILGMNVLNSLQYEPGSNSWENGRIYDAKHGREWNASGYIDNNGLLKLKGYWHFKFIGKTMTFERPPDDMAMAVK